MTKLRSALADLPPPRFVAAAIAISIVVVAALSTPSSRTSHSTTIVSSSSPPAAPHSTSTERCTAATTGTFTTEKLKVTSTANDAILTSGAIQRPTVAAGGTSLVLSLPSQYEVSTERYTIQSTEGTFVVPFVYVDKVLSLGFNWDGTARTNNASAAIFEQFESKYQLNNSPLPADKVNEWHINSVDVTGAVHRPFGAVTAWDGSFTQAGVSAMTTTITDMANATKAKFDFQTSPGAISFYAPTAVAADGSALVVQNAAQTTNTLIVNSAGSTLNAPFNVNSTAQNVLNIENNNPVAGITTFNLTSGAGAFSAQIAESSTGDLQISNRLNTGTRTFMDVSGGGMFFRNAAAANTMIITDAPIIGFYGDTARLSTTVDKWSSSSTNPLTAADTGIGRASAGVVEINNGTLGTLRDLSARALGVTNDFYAGTVRTGGASGPKWSSGAGVPAASCTVGDLYSNTTGGAGTTFYVCEVTNTWAAK